MNSAIYNAAQTISLHIRETNLQRDINACAIDNTSEQLRRNPLISCNNVRYVFLIIQFKTSFSYKLLGYDW